MTDINNLNFEEIRDQFLSGVYQFDTDAYVEASEELHNKLVNISDLVPMLKSDNKACQRSATYISALEGDRACSIFPQVFDLLESPWVEVRDEVCDCFIDCATKAEQFIALFKHLEDPEQCIRLRIINVISGLKDEQIDMIFEYFSSNSAFDDISLGFSVLHEQRKSGVSFESLKKQMAEGTKITKLFFYAIAIREKIEANLFDLVKLSGSSDVLRHYEIYFGDR